MFAEEFGRSNVKMQIPSEATRRCMNFPIFRLLKKPGPACPGVPIFRGHPPFFAPARLAGIGARSRVVARVFRGFQNHRSALLWRSHLSGPVRVPLSWLCSAIPVRQFFSFVRREVWRAALSY